MKAVQIKKYGGSEAVEMAKDTPEPKASAGKIVVEIKAAGVNPVDWKIREGYLDKMAPLTFPATLGGDFSGVVREVGEGVTGFKKGDDVYGTALVLAGGSGAFAEVALASVKAVALKPKKVNYLEAAALPLAGVSAIQALMEHINLKNGEKILIHGGAGGIGTFAVQIAKHIGAYVAATASTEELDYVKKLGADKAIDYKKERFEEVVKDFDSVFDTVGGETYTRSFMGLKKGGTIVSMLEPQNAELMNRYGVKAISQFTQITSERLVKLGLLVDQGAIKVNIDKIFFLEEVGDALEYLRTGHPKGKVVVMVE